MAEPLLGGNTVENSTPKATIAGVLDIIAGVMSLIGSAVLFILGVVGSGAVSSAGVHDPEAAFEAARRIFSAIDEDQLVYVFKKNGTLNMVDFYDAIGSNAYRNNQSQKVPDGKIASMNAGWYADNDGTLVLRKRRDISGNISLGELQSDATLDLVNSARVDDLVGAVAGGWTDFHAAWQ